jgi:predicted enzyme related to lactoylglutathione lyase
MSIARIAFTMYPVTDMARAVTFYTDVLGLKKTDFATDFWVEFDVAASTFGIGNFEQVGKAGTAQSLALEVDDMSAFRKALAERGHESSEPFETKVCWISVVRDPDGNQIWLHQSKPPLERRTGVIG